MQKIRKSKIRRNRFFPPHTLLTEKKILCKDSRAGATNGCKTSLLGEDEPAAMTAAVEEDDTWREN